MKTHYTTAFSALHVTVLYYSALKLKKPFVLRIENFFNYFFFTNLMISKQIWVYDDWIYDSNITFLFQHKFIKNNIFTKFKKPFFK